MELSFTKIVFGVLGFLIILLALGVTFKSFAFFVLRGLLLFLRCTRAIIRFFNPPPFHASIEPSGPGRKIYRLTIENVGKRTISRVTLHYSPALHPGTFGLDDTHMPKKIWEKPPLNLTDLAPGAPKHIEVGGYDVPDRYDGPPQCPVFCEYSTSDLAGKTKRIVVVLEMKIRSGQDSSL